jgi:hypothetical protein
MLRSAIALIVRFILDLNYCVVEIRPWAIQGGVLSYKRANRSFSYAGVNRIRFKGTVIVLAQENVSDPYQVTPKEDR